MHLLVIIAAFAFVAITPYLDAAPRSGDDGVQTAELTETLEADSEDEA